jgi:outer membrane receptor for ferrienterochelin and colicins
MHAALRAQTRTRWGHPLLSTRLVHALTLLCICAVTTVPAAALGQATPEPVPTGQNAGDVGLAQMAEMDLDQLLSLPIVSATQTEQRVVDAPSVVSVLTRAEMIERGYQSVAEALQHSVGFYVVDDHIVPNVAVRGISGGLRSESGLIKVMIDSRPVPFRPTGGNWLGPELIPLSAVERIEILRGPASAVYGADAFLGVINIITRRGEDVAGADLTGTGLVALNNPGGGFDMSAGMRRDNLDVLVAGKYLHEDYSGLRLPASSPAPRVSDYHRGRTASHDLTRDSYSSLAKLRYHLSPEHSLYASAYAAALQRGAEFSDWSQLANGLDQSGRRGINQVSLANSSVSLGGDFQLSPTWTVNAQLGGFYGTPTPSDRVEVGSSVYYVERKLDSRGLDAQLSSSWTLPQLTLTASAGGIVDRQQLPSTHQVLKLPVGDQDAGDTRTEGAIEQGHKTFYNPGARMQAIWRPFKNIALDLTGGGRYDYHSIYGHRVTGRAGIVYSPNDRLNFKLLYGSAFKAPSTQLLYGVPMRPGDIQGNPGLKPQLIRSLEFFTTLAPFSWLTATTGVFFGRVTDKTEFLPREGNLQAQNISELNSLSWETELSANYQKWLTAYANVAYTRARRDPGVQGYQAELLGVQATAYPGLVVNGGLRGRPVKGLVLSSELGWVGKRLATDSNILENGARYYLPARLLWDLNVRYASTYLMGDQRESALMLRVKNILGTRGPDPGYNGTDYPLAPRVVMLGVEQQF